MRLSEDYFTLDQEAFMRRWMKGRTTEVKRQTTGKSWTAVVEALGNPVQQKIVANDRDATNVLVLAGPGSGNTNASTCMLGKPARRQRRASANG